MKIKLKYENRLHKYEVVELGELSDSQKENTCWSNGSISGSKMTRIFKEPDIVLKEDLGLIDKIDLHADPIIDEKLRRGTDIEEFIRQQAEKEWGITINTDKATYNLMDTVYYANIDGFDEDNIYEIKNTETDDMEAIVQRYKWQGVYYCWFFGRKQVQFIALIRGYKLRRRIYTPTREDYMELARMMSNYIAAYNLQDADFFNKKNEDEDETVVYEINDENTERKLEQLVKIQDKIKELEVCEKDLKSYFAEVLNQSGTSYVSKKSGCKVSLIKSTRTGNIDVDQLTSLYPTIEIPRKSDYTTTTVRITKPKQ